jgi:hypothetical protein
VSRWFRHYAGMMRDEKLVAVAVRAKQPVERVLWVWGAILESAAEINDGGKYELDAEEVAYFLRTDVVDITSILAGLETSGRLTSGIVVAWSDRQFESDRGAARQAAYRERKRVGRVDGYSEKTVSDVTPPSRYAEVTPQETDTETYTEKINTPRKARVQSREVDGFEDFWAVYPRKTGKGAARKAFRNATLTADPNILFHAAERYAASKLDPKFTPHPATWLNQERWLDEELQPKPAPEPFKGTSNGQVFVKQGTDAFDAWSRVWKRTKGISPPTNQDGGWFFPSEYPQEKAA